jgi:hypothetical protein
MNCEADPTTDPACGEYLGIYNWNSNWQWKCPTAEGLTDVHTEVMSADTGELRLTVPSNGMSFTLWDSYCHSSHCVWVLDKHKREEAGSIYITKRADMKQPTLQIYFKPFVNLNCDSAFQ